MSEEADVLGQTRITTNYQITLPKKIRKELNAKIGDIAVFSKDDKRIYIKIVKIS